MRLCAKELKSLGHDYNGSKLSKHKAMVPRVPKVKILKESASHAFVLVFPTSHQYIYIYTRLHKTELSDDFLDFAHQTKIWARIATDISASNWPSLKFEWFTS